MYQRILAFGSILKGFGGFLVNDSPNTCQQFDTLQFYEPPPLGEEVIES
jgi:hypothetical protein